MPYQKEIGRTPVYVFGVRRRLFDEHLSRILKHRDVPHFRQGMFMVFEDSYDAYVERVYRMGPYRRWLESKFGL